MLNWYSPCFFGAATRPHHWFSLCFWVLEAHPNPNEASMPTIQYPLVPGSWSLEDPPTICRLFWQFSDFYATHLSDAFLWHQPCKEYFLAPLSTKGVFWAPTSNTRSLQNVTKVSRAHWWKLRKSASDPTFGSPDWSSRGSTTRWQLI